MKRIKNETSLLTLRKQIQTTQILLIILITILLTTGGTFIAIKSNSKAIDENLHNTSQLITKLYFYVKHDTQQQLCDYMDELVNELSNVDIISIVDTNNRRVYHSNHELINTIYDGVLPDFKKHNTNYFIEKSNGPSGPQRRTYSAIIDEQNQYIGFIMTIRLESSIRLITVRTILLFLIVTIIAIVVEILISAALFKKIKKQFFEFTEDFEGTKFLVDSMRANNHDFTNKLHVILGLIQIGQYKKAESYIQNISIIQKETVSTVVKAIDNPSFAALLIGKIARASECNVKFLLKDDISYHSKHINIPSEALVTITGNLLDNAFDAMNLSEKDVKELHFGVYTKPGQLLMVIRDTGIGIKEENKEKIFENGFSTKGNGRGVGLYHTKQLINSLGGEIFFETQENAGTCFTVILKNTNFK